nr:NAD(P)/FAD-dependent oxidoreductase [Streptomyces milbemycinicus]
MNTYVTGRTLLDQSWDAVIVATRGTPAAPRIPGAGLVSDTWDVLAGVKRPQGRVMVYDDHGGNQALDAVEALARGGATVEIVTPERTLSPDVGSLTASGYVNSLAESGVTGTLLRRLHGVAKTAEGLEVALGVDGGRGGQQKCPCRNAGYRPAAAERSEQSPAYTVSRSSPTLSSCSPAAVLRQTAVESAGCGSSRPSPGPAPRRWARI